MGLATMELLVSGIGRKSRGGEMKEIGSVMEEGAAGYYYWVRRWWRLLVGGNWCKEKVKNSG